ncbi:MAG TPA: hypothetical protein VLI45_09110 [Acidobacteriaceae bacterium]|nr:hypothetical protein [Acidobacteriaceae bacterium]
MSAGRGACRTFAPSATKTEMQMLAIERSLAYEYACSVIDVHTLNQTDPDDCVHFDLDSCEGEIAELVVEAVEYLEWRGLIARDSAHPQLIEILDEDAVAVSVELHDA